MDTLQVSLLVGGLIFAASMFAFLGLAKRKINLRARLEPAQEETVENFGLGLRQQLRDLLVSIGERIPRTPEEMSRQERRLAQAGYRRKDAVLWFHGSHIMVFLACLGAFAAVGYLYRHTILAIVLSIFFGMVIPDVWLKRTIARRKEAIQCGLPDAMDLAVIAVEAGLGLDQALLRVGDEIVRAHPELSDELRLRNLEINMGRSRADALRNLADRTGVDDLRALVAILIQTDKFGTSVGQALRTFSESLRTKRRQRAEEQAAKLAIKMVVPMVVFIFPGVFIVILGPAFITILRDLLPTLAGDK